MMKRLDKEHRKSYARSDSRNYDFSCRHGGSCTRCSEGRQFRNKRRMPIEDEIPEKYWR